MAGRVKHVYLERLDLAAALAEKDRIEQERETLAAYEAAKKAEPEKPAEWQTEAPAPRTRREAHRHCRPGHVHGGFSGVGHCRAA